MPITVRCISLLLCLFVSFSMALLSPERGMRQGLNMLRVIEGEQRFSLEEASSDCVCPAAGQNTTSCYTQSKDECIEASKAFLWAIGVLYGECFPRKLLNLFMSCSNNMHDSFATE